MAGWPVLFVCSALDAVVYLGVFLTLTIQCHHAVRHRQQSPLLQSGGQVTGPAINAALSGVCLILSGLTVFFSYRTGTYAKADTRLFWALALGQSTAGTARQSVPALGTAVRIELLLPCAMCIARLGWLAGVLVLSPSVLPLLTFGFLLSAFLELSIVAIIVLHSERSGAPSELVFANLMLVLDAILSLCWSDGGRLLVLIWFSNNAAAVLTALRALSVTADLRRISKAQQA